MPNVHVSAMGVSSLLEPVYLDDSFVLARGQLFFEVDTREMKIGDGVTAWSSLDSIGGTSASVTGFDDEGTAAPTTGSWSLGWRRRNTAPAAGENIGWVNLTGGGCNFKPFSSISV